MNAEDVPSSLSPTPLNAIALKLYETAVLSPVIVQECSIRPATQPLPTRDPSLKWAFIQILRMRDPLALSGPNVSLTDPLPTLSIDWNVGAEGSALVTVDAAIENTGLAALLPALFTATAEMS